MKLAIDMASILKTCLAVGKDVEGKEVEFEGKRHYINSAAYGYENSINSIKAAMDELGLAPIDLILVQEGMHSKSRRCMIDATYKSKRTSSPPEYYEQYNALKQQVEDTLVKLGAIVVTQDFVEGDDVLAYLATNTEEDMVIMSNDGDMTVLNMARNEYGAKVAVRINGETGYNKYGPFDYSLVTAYKALVGDTSDSIKGCPGFGVKAFDAFFALYGEDGLREIQGMMEAMDFRQLEQLAADNKCKLLQKIFDERDTVLRSYQLAKLHPEWVDTMKHKLKWRAGYSSFVEDERLSQWNQITLLVTADNYEKVYERYVARMAETPFVTFDLETSTPDDSDDWLEAQGKGGVDVISSEISGCSFNFGRNLNYTVYVSLDHADTKNVTADQLASFFEAIPKNKLRVAHNAQGFELPVLFNKYSAKWADNGWRGFVPNCHDTRIMATHWDENQQHGLKFLSNHLFGVVQTTYDEVTQGRKMREVTGKEVLGYGADDSALTASIYNFFKLILQLEHTYTPFCEIEQKPMYLQALAYVQGMPVDMERLKGLEAADVQLQKKHWATLEAYLITKGWEGVNPPVYDEITPAAIKEAVKIITGEELKTMVRTTSKLIALVREMEGTETLAPILETGDPAKLTALVANHYTGKPEFNSGSPLQLSNLLYKVMGLPVRLRNKATDVMRAKGIKEGNPRTDDDAINMAIKMKDAPEQEIEVLKALLELKSITTRSGLYWKAWPGFIHWNTGKIHPSFRQSGTNTRRYTCSNPNFAQLEANPDGIRSCVLPHKKNAIVLSFDFQAQEVRQLADYSQDENLLSCFIGEKLRDIHSITASAIAKVSYEEFIAMRKSSDPKVASLANEIRQIAKVVFFSSAYGAMAPKIAETLGISEAEAQKYLDALDKQFPRVAAWKAEVEAAANKVGYVEIAGGTRRHLRDLLASEDKWQASKALRQGPNAMIQSAGSNQVKKVMTQIWDSDLIEKYDYRWYFSVYDETVHSCAAEHAKEVALRLHKMMCAPFLTTVPAMSSLGLGKNYGQLIELGENFKPEQIDEAIKKLCYA